MNTQSFQKFPKSFLRLLIPNLGSILVMAAMLFVYNARAAGLNAGTSPSTISYQGTLSTAGGTAVNTSIGLTFRLYNIQSGGTALWTEAHTGANIVPVNNGLFNVLLGGITPIPSAVWNNSTVYLGVQVDGDNAELSPREMVSAVPMAMMTANITVPEGSVVTSKLANNSVTSEKMALTYWNIRDNVSGTQIINITPNGNYVEIAPYNFTFVPTIKGVVVLNLSLTFSSSQPNSRVYCSIGVNGSTTQSDSAVVKKRFVGDVDECSVHFTYPVQAGLTYRFTVSIYSNITNTLTIHHGAFTNFSAVFFGAP